MTRDWESPLSPLKRAALHLGSYCNMCATYVVHKNVFSEYNIMHQSVLYAYSSCKDVGIYFETRALQMFSEADANVHSKYCDLDR